MTAEVRATPGGSTLHKMSWARRMVSSRLVGAFIGELPVNPSTTPFRLRPFRRGLPALGCSCRIVAIRRRSAVAPKINGGNEGGAMHRALNHVTWERHLPPILAPAAHCTNAPLVG